MDHCEKELTPSDVNQRLAVTKGMLEFLPEIDPENDVPIRVLDETGKETSGFAKAKYNDHHDVMYICLDIWAA
ncbi:hypothetical protein Pyn_21524 [Prunus yedoensis var. nudiflora]|uniref:Uncharacterized protein n=1 Tax=Prunus yedoensis var. nudiflora TaxID=2094558 RepID=A0A314XH62_PRUYE|nr:hypothetical protein Pyn_21524 [Prunus yedoensis var. nudiflora]